MQTLADSPRAESEPDTRSTPRRILILGSGGAGKSTLARRIGAALDLPVVHLDTLYWKSGWVEGDQSETMRRIEAICSMDAWVMDGNYTRYLVPRLAAADMVVYMDIPRWRCVLGVLRRVARYRGRTRPDMGEGCPERFDFSFIRWVWEFPMRTKPVILQELGKAERSFDLITVRSYAEAERVLRQLSAPGPYTQYKMVRKEKSQCTTTRR